MPVGWVERRPARPEIGNIDPHDASALPDAMDLFHRRDNVLEMFEHVVEIDGFGARRLERVWKDVEIVDDVGTRRRIDVDTYGTCSPR